MSVMQTPEAMMVPVSPRHSVLLAPEYAQLIDRAPDHDFTMRTIARREANGLQLMSAEMVIAGNDTRKEFPLADKYPMHFRKTYFPGRLRGDPSIEFANQQRASEVLGSPPPIGFTKDTFRACFVPGKPYSRLTPFGIEPVENNVQVAEELNLGLAIGLWWLCTQAFDQLNRLHAAGLAHGDMELHNIAVSPAPAEAVRFHRVAQRGCLLAMRPRTPTRPAGRHGHGTHRRVVPITRTLRAQDPTPSSGVIRNKSPGRVFAHCMVSPVVVHRSHISTFCQKSKCCPRKRGVKRRGCAAGKSAGEDQFRFLAPRTIATSVMRGSTARMAASAELNKESPRTFS